VGPPRDWEYGERQATVDDPFGHRWVLNQTLADVAPEEWGGSTVNPRPSPRQLTSAHEGCFDTLPGSG